MLNGPVRPNRPRGGLPSVRRVGTGTRGNRAAVVVTAVLAAGLFLTGCTSSNGSGVAASAASSSATGSSGAQRSAGSTASGTSTGTTLGTTPPSASSASPTAGSTATVGALVADFPSTLLPVMSGARVKASSFDRTKTPATASVTAAVSATSTDVLAYYTKVFQDQGFTALPGDAVGSVAAKDFSRANGTETAQVSVVPSEAGVTFTVSANVLPASLK